MPGLDDGNIMDKNMAYLFVASFIFFAPFKFLCCAAS